MMVSPARIGHTLKSQLVSVVITLTACVVLAGAAPMAVSADDLPELLNTIPWPTEADMFGDFIAPVGDQDGDGYSDFLTFQMQWTCYLYRGGMPGDTLPALTWHDISSYKPASLGDINGDFHGDFCLQGRSSYGWQLNLYFGGTLLDTVRDLWFGLDSLSPITTPVITHDINGNGSDEILCWEGKGRRILLFELGTDSDSIPDLILTPFGYSYEEDYYWFGRSVITGDYNGDGFDDLVTAMGGGPAGARVFLYWGGPSFDTIPDMEFAMPPHPDGGTGEFGSILVSLGDFSGDGYDDFLAGVGVYFNDSINYVYFGGPDIDTFPDITIPDRQTEFASAGDVNNDGYQDLISGYPLWTSGYGYVNIYLGGPTADSLPDVHIDVGDLWPPGGEFGRGCTGIGDYNGDGIDDFAFSLQRSTGGQILVFSGWDQATDVEVETDPNLPESYQLFQNYPNPFNATTVIEFTLPTRSHVELAVYNVLGEKVATIADRELSAGTHRVTWSGEKVASGVYLVRLTSELGMLSRKMVLMK